MNKTFLFILLGITALSSCEKYVKEKDLDKQIIVEFPGGAWSALNTTTFVNTPSNTYLVDFNRSDYPKVDSITFHAILSTQTPQDSVYIRLYNLTDNVEIPNSLLSASTPDRNNLAALQTNNIIKSLPEKQITLVIQIKGVTSPSRYVFAENAYLKLRRN